MCSIGEAVVVVDLTLYLQLAQCFRAVECRGDIKIPSLRFSSSPARGSTGVCRCRVCGAGVAVGPENVIVESPLGASYKVAREFFWWAVQNFGPEVNLGNVAPDHVTLLEMIRRGTYWRGYARFVDTADIARENESAGGR